MDKIFYKNILHKIPKYDNIDVNEKNVIFISIDPDIAKSGLYILSIKSKKYIDIEINNKKYFIKKNIMYNIVCFLNIKSKIKLSKSICGYLKDTDVMCFYISQYKNPFAEYKYDYEVIYSFDKKYFSGGFASLHSLLYNFNQNKINNLNINFFINEYEVDIFTRELLSILDKINIYPNITLHIINSTLVDEVFLNTKCLKGGNHLLNLGNYARLMVGFLLDVDMVLYIDADTIVQKDISIAFDNIREHNFIIYGKKSQLTYKNILVSYNYDKVYDLLGQTFNIDQNVIYTGTIFIRPKLFKDYFNKIINIVLFHNNLKDGLYKLFTMSLINLCFWDKLKYYDEYLKNVVDLGYNQNITLDELENGDVLDWSGIKKPWFLNGMYKQYWKKYNIFNYETENIDYNKNTIENFN